MDDSDKVLVARKDILAAKVLIKCLAEILVRINAIEVPGAPEILILSDTDKTKGIIEKARMALDDWRV